MEDINLKDFDSSEAFFVHQVIKHTNHSLFLTGKAGTGKSTLLKLILADVEKRAILLSQNGLSAKNIGGQTIHSFFQLLHKEFLPNISDVKNRYSSKKINFIKSADLIVIDEISLTPSYIVDTIDKLLKSIMQNLKPFGGKQILLIGDPFQLPPVVPSEDREIILKNYPSRHFFGARGVNSFLMVELEECYRQKDKVFMDILDAIKIDSITESQLRTLNEVCYYQKNSRPQASLTLTTKNLKAEKINNENLSKLIGESFEYVGITQGNFNNKTCIASERLILKIGARVMFVKNNRDLNFANGSMGIITALEKDKIFVLPDDQESIIEVPRAEWEEFEYAKDGSQQTKIGSFSQFPLVLGWAISIHKSQGLTLQSAHIDMTDKFFEHGQLYVALSRCVSMDGLSISRPIVQQDIIVEEEVKTFYKSLKSNNHQNHMNKVIDELLLNDELSAG